jgi:hypothetical protein
MSKAEQIVATAQAEVGYIETGNNHTKYQKIDQPWCGAFVNWVYSKNSIKIPDCISTVAGANAFLKAKAWQSAETATPKVGDLAFFDFPGDGVDRISHIGIVIKDNADGTVTTIEGNTSPDKKGDQRNGGEVCVKIRAYKKKNRGNLKLSLPVFIVGFGKPTITESN